MCDVHYLNAFRWWLQTFPTSNSDSTICHCTHYATYISIVHEASGAHCTHCNTITVLQFCIQQNLWCFASRMYVSHQHTIERCSVRLTHAVVVLPHFPLTRFAMFLSRRRTHSSHTHTLSMCLSKVRVDRIHVRSDFKAKWTKCSRQHAEEQFCYIFPVVSGSRLTLWMVKMPPTLPSPTPCHTFYIWEEMML